MNPSSKIAPSDELSPQIFALIEDVVEIIHLIYNTDPEKITESSLAEQFQEINQRCTGENVPGFNQLRPFLAQLLPLRIEDLPNEKRTSTKEIPSYIFRVVQAMMERPFTTSPLLMQISKHSSSPSVTLYYEPNTTISEIMDDVAMLAGFPEEDVRDKVIWRNVAEGARKPGFRCITGVKI